MTLMLLVVDTSVIAKVFLDEADNVAAKRLMEQTINGDITLLAPSLLLYEVNNVLVSKRVTGHAYDEAMSLLMDWTKEGYLGIAEASEDLLRRAEAIASIDTQGKGHISSFDATFHALALMHGATFVTSDQSYVRKTKPLLGSVELLNDVTL
jgi:predicted nucleic acid-binding protein